MSLALELRHGGPLLDFTAEITEGVITALVGPSGSGKSSILRAIAGLLRLRHEQVSYDGESWSDSGHGVHLPTRLRPIGLVPQQYALFPHLTVLGNVMTALTQLPRDERVARAMYYLELARVDGLERRYPHELSGGQTQRVALARAIARQPAVLLLDEPFSAVDRTTRKHLYLELRRLHQQLKTTVVLVTHDLDDAAQLASQLILLRHGRRVQSGPTAQVLTRPCSEAAARLLDIANVFEARVEIAPSKETMQLRWGPHRLQVAGTAPSGVEKDIKFAILPHNVLLVRDDKPWGSHLENPIPVIVEEVIGLGAEALVWLLPQGLSQTRLQMRLSEHAVRRYAVAAAKKFTVCLRADDVIPLGTDESDA
jgi:molybdate transport system ATP-binding protein